ncbi:hypothetical protein [Emticicia agri]|uniref:Uncharacterized protein n=1 Tax=Emticicia agri TaxID=2492393 RepID=A0A4Q5LUR5_9BACT|nr:hypothetical protein [Emticicia agri]RYU93183.1 hypothetical protein EWM59_23415 [Emticicia agri]
MKKIIFILSFFSSQLIYSQTDEREIKAKTYLENLVSNQSKGVIKVSSFAKSDGYSKESEGMKLYVLEFESIVTITRDCFKEAGLGQWDNFKVITEIFSRDAPFYTRYNAGTNIELKGDFTFLQTEKGWRVQDFLLRKKSVIPATQTLFNSSQLNNSNSEATNNRKETTNTVDDSKVREVTSWFFGKFDCTFKKRISTSFYQTNGTFTIQEGKKAYSGNWEIVKNRNSEDYFLKLNLDRLIANEMILPIVEMDNKHFVLKQVGGSSTCQKVE